MNSEFETVKSRIARLVIEMAPLRERLKALAEEHHGEVLRLQAVCPHPVEQVVEGEYRPAGWISYAEPPFLVCRACGYAEEGWSAGYWRLAHLAYDRKVATMDRAEARKLAVTFVRQADMERLGRYGEERARRAQGKEI